MFYKSLIEQQGSIRWQILVKTDQSACCQSIDASTRLFRVNPCQIEIIGIHRDDRQSTKKNIILRQGLHHLRALCQSLLQKPKVMKRLDLESARLRLRLNYFGVDERENSLILGIQRMNPSTIKSDGSAAHSLLQQQIEVTRRI